MKGSLGWAIFIWAMTSGTVSGFGGVMDSENDFWFILAGVISGMVAALFFGRWVDKSERRIINGN